MPSFGSYILWHSNRLMSKVISHIDGSFSINIYFSDTHSSHIHKRECSKLEAVGLIKEGLGFGNNDYRDCGGILKALFLGP